MQLPEIPAQAGLSLDELLGLLHVVEIRRARTIPDLLLPLHQLAHHLECGLSISSDQALRFLELAQQQRESLENGPLGGDRRSELRRLETLRGTVERLPDARSLEDSQAIRSTGADLTAPLADIAQTLHQLQEERLDVPLILNRRQRQRLLPIPGLLRHRCRHVANDRLQSQDPLALRRQLGRLQASQEVLTLERQTHDDAPDHFSSPFDGIDTNRLVVLLLAFSKQFYDLGHLRLDQAGDVLLHAHDVAVELQVLEAVLLELTHLQIQDP